jgi:hypothetical protein
VACDADVSLAFRGSAWRCLRFDGMVGLMKPFTTDGCSGGMTWLWLKVKGQRPPWDNCCVLHDYLYWRGGTRQERLWADIKLLHDVIDNGHPWWAIAMFAAVRVGGHPIFPFSWKWGYGHSWPKYSYD